MVKVMKKICKVSLFRMAFPFFNVRQRGFIIAANELTVYAERNGKLWCGW